MSTEFLIQKHAQPLHEVQAIQTARGDFPREPFPFVHIEPLVLQHSVFTQKHKARRQRHWLVAIYASAVAAKTEKVSCDNLDRIEEHGRPPSSSMPSCPSPL